jgi:lysozyme family protein
MKANWESAFAHVIKSEGGYVWDKNDAGGETNHGVTRVAWGEYLGRAIMDGEMKALTVDQVKPFYKKQYWDRCRCDDLPAGVDYAVFDFAVNAGTGQAAKFLQRAAGTKDDGAIGPGTLAAVSNHQPNEILERFSEQKEAFYRGIVSRRPDQEKFLKGWLARVEAVETAANTMLA